MLGLRFLGIRARLLLLFVSAGLAGAFCLLPLLASDQLAAAYPRIAIVVAAGSLLAAWIGRSVVRPIEDLEQTLRSRLVGREVMPPRDWGLDEIHDLGQVLTRFLATCDQRDAKARGVSPVSGLEADRELRALLKLGQQLPGTDGAAGAARRLLAGVRDHLELGHVTLMIHDKTSGQLDLFAGAGLDATLLAELERHGPRPVKFAEGVGIAGLALKTGRTKVAPRGSRDKDFAQLGGEFESQIRNLACIPLRSGGEIIGVLNAVNIGRAGAFDLTSVEFLEEAGRLLEGWLPGLLGDEFSEDLDPLTGVLRYDTWQARLDDEVERHRRFPRGLGVAIVELAYPDGEPEGGVRNEVLGEVGAMVNRAARSLDAVGREGDRFFLALPESDLLGAIHLGGRVKDMIDRASIAAEGRLPRFVAMVGVATSPDVVDDPGKLVAAAEDAVVRSRHAGDYRLTLSHRMVA